jgi:hypothetical protein
MPRLFDDRRILGFGYMSIQCAALIDKQTEHPEIQVLDELNRAATALTSRPKSSADTLLEHHASFKSVSTAVGLWKFFPTSYSPCVLRQSNCCSMKETIPTTVSTVERLGRICFLTAIRKRVVLWWSSSRSLKHLLSIALIQVWLIVDPCRRFFDVNF